MTNRKPTATSRLKQDYLRLKRDPVPYIQAEPLPSNILEWHYVVKGPEDSPYHGGYYYGTLLFPREFPFKPPSIYMITPNGRFKTNTRLCLSISDFHPDTWNPAWSVATILTGLLSFMLETTPTLGSYESSTIEKQYLAKKSLTFNLKNSHFRELFPEICEEINLRLKKLENTQQQQPKNGYQFVNGHSSSIFGSGGGINNGLDLIGNNGDIAENFLIDNNLSKINDNNNLAKGANNTNNNNKWYSIYSNLIVIISFAVFALIVNYVIKSLND